MSTSDKHYQAVIALAVLHEKSLAWYTLKMRVPRPQPKPTISKWEYSQPVEILG